MAWVVDRLAEAVLGYSSIDIGLVDFVSEGTVHRKAKNLPGFRLAGKNRPQETAYFFRNARALAQIAREFAEQYSDTVVAVLFRDSDGTRTSGRGEWQAKWDSMIGGFRFEDYHCGVPMLPKPKSEAWVLCALKPQQPYQHCRRIEDASGNDASPNSLKIQLEVVLGEPGSCEVLVDKVKNAEIDPFQITDMPSFLAFRCHLESVLTDVLEEHPCVD
jgi:hypothetical protein